MITRPPLRYLTPDTDTPLYHLFLIFLFSKVEKKANIRTQPWHIHRAFNQLNQIARFR